MVGDAPDMARRMRAILPVGWFGDESSTLDQLLLAVGSGWSSIYALIQFVVQQSRIATATSSFLDLLSSDFFGDCLPRRQGEQDGYFSSRIRQELFRARCTRSAVNRALLQLTGRPPLIFEPGLTSDTGGYGLGGIGYDVGGGWGSLVLPFQLFITVFRPAGRGIAQFAGYGTGGIPVYGNLNLELTQVSDSQLFSSIPPLLPVATVAWARISN